MGVKANAEAAVWRSHAANTTTSSDQGTKIRRRVRRGRDAPFPEGEAVLRAPYGWYPWPAGARNEDKSTARRRRSERSPVKLSFESQPPLLADVSKPAFPCARDCILLLFLFMFRYCCHSLNRYAVYKTYQYQRVLNSL